MVSFLQAVYGGIHTCRLTTNTKPLQNDRLEKRNTSRTLQRRTLLAGIAFFALPDWLEYGQFSGIEEKIQEPSPGTEDGSMR